MAEHPFLSFFRRCIYNRWFYALFAGVCLMDAASDLLDVVNDSGHTALDIVSLVMSSVAAIFAGAIFADLHFRRGKP